jgi:hypothetical protein
VLSGRGTGAGKYSFLHSVYNLDMKTLAQTWPQGQEKARK